MNFEQGWSIFYIYLKNFMTIWKIMIICFFSNLFKSIFCYMVNLYFFAESLDIQGDQKHTATFILPITLYVHDQVLARLAHGLERTKIMLKTLVMHLEAGNNRGAKQSIKDIGILSVF